MDCGEITLGQWALVSETSTSKFHRHSSSLQHCQIRHNNLAQKIKLQVVASRKIRIRLPPPDELGKSNPSLVSSGKT